MAESTYERVCTVIKTAGCTNLDVNMHATVLVHVLESLTHLRYITDYLGLGHFIVIGCYPIKQIDCQNNVKKSNMMLPFFSIIITFKITIKCLIT